MLSTRYGPVGTRFSFLGTGIGFLKHLKKPALKFKLGCEAATAQRKPFTSDK